MAKRKQGAGTANTGKGSVRNQSENGKQSAGQNGAEARPVFGSKPDFEYSYTEEDLNVSPAPKKSADKPSDENAAADSADKAHADAGNGAKDAQRAKGGKKSAKAAKNRRAREADDTLDTSSVEIARGISHEERRRRQNRRDFIRIACFILAIALLIGAGILGYRYTTVHAIRISGSENYGEAQLLSMSGLRAGKNIFLYNEKSIREQMNSIPDIRIISVSKSLPDEIHILVSDITASAAILAANGSYIYISDDGYVLSMGEKTASGMPVIRGMTGVGFSLHTYIDKQSPSVRTVSAVKLLKALRENEFTGEVFTIDLSSSAYVTLELGHGYTAVLGSASSAADCVATAAEAYRRFLPVYPDGGTLQIFPGSTVVDFTPAA